MSFYIRKRIKVGPFRFNISKHGVGVSTGVRGFRVGTGPHGNYISMAEHGIYYRKGLGTKASRQRAAERRSKVENKPRHGPEEPSVKAQPPMEMEPPEVALGSAEALDLTDSNSAELLGEMNRRNRRWSLWPLALLLGLLLLGWLAYTSFPAWPFGIAAALLLVLVLFIGRNDQVRRTTVLLYHLDENAESAYQSLHDAFNGLMRCAQAWHVDAEALPDLQESRMNAGAKTLVRRSPLHLGFAAPRQVKTNVSTPFISLKDQTLYFFPDRLLVVEGRDVGAVAYADLHATADNAEFVERGPVPRDAEPAGTAWEYENKSGGPDKRIEHNRQFPVVVYSTLRLKSGGGLNEMLQFSRPDVGNAFAEAVKKLGEIKPTQEQNLEKEHE